jgi:hypothetical protein
MRSRLHGGGLARALWLPSWRSTDSMWLAATFAASATKIFDGKGSVPACSGR